MKTRLVADSVRYQRMTTAELREAFLIEDLFSPGAVELSYTDLDRAVVGSVVPTDKPLALGTSKQQLASDYFCERREIGVMNIGAAGAVTIDGKRHDMESCDMLYIGRGSRNIEFESKTAAQPAQFYLVSYPAHTAHPTVRVRQSEAESVSIGSVRDANLRTIRKYIQPKNMTTCQIVMGYTELKEGSIWNTMPPHTHLRRSEVYMYFNVDPAARIFHMMGTPQETRHLVMKNGQAVLSPSWSIHAGGGTRAYCFVWAMGGENQAYDDMDAAALEMIR